ncbi:MAG: 1,3-beta-galactosyl-N-acetylhexosamine phosphorylase [Ruthenibacterium sp.]
MSDTNKTQKGRVTIPTDIDVVPQTLELMRRWGADAIRDCDGTDFPASLKDVGAKVYSTYYTTRKDNAWAKANPDEVQQCYIMTGFYTATGGALSIPLMQGISPELLAANTRDDITRWWEVVDRTTGAVVAPADWRYDEAAGCVVITAPAAFHDYTVSFLAYLIWDPVHMYNAVVNDWKNFEHQITFDVRQPKTRAYTMQRLRTFIAEHPYVNVIRYTTFFHQFTMTFDELKREKYVDWYGYSASVSPYILAQFEAEVGYKFRPEFIIDEGYYNNQYRVPSREFKDFQAFQRREVAKLAKEMVDITHECGKEAMMFLGDHWIGTEPFMEEFKSIGLDAVVGSVGNGSTLRLISDIPGVKYTEGRFLPYFFPDTFHKGGDPVREAKENWVTARRAILRKPIDRIGYGGYLKLACEFPDFIDYVESVCDEFRTLYENIKGTTPYCVKTVAVLNSWGKMRAWGCHMVHHALYQKQNYSYAGVIEALSGAPFDVRFLSFDELKADAHVLDDVDVLLNIGDADTAHTGGAVWEDADISAAVKRFVYNGGGFLGVGEPSGHQYEGHCLQLAGVLGVEKETGFTLNYDKYNWDEHRAHFILEDCGDAHDVDFGEGKKSIYALPSTEVLIQRDKEVQLAAHAFGKGRAVYLSGLPYSFVNSRVLYRSILWSAHGEAALCKWFSTNYHVEVHAYVKNGKYCVVNNTYEPQQTTVYRGDGSSFALKLAANEILWYEI